MPLIYNGTTIDQTSGTLKFGTTEVEKVIYNGVTVWEKIREQDITPSLASFPNCYTISPGCYAHSRQCNSNISASGKPSYALLLLNNVSYVTRGVNLNENYYYQNELQTTPNNIAHLWVRAHTQSSYPSDSQDQIYLMTATGLFSRKGYSKIRFKIYSLSWSQRIPTEVIIDDAANFDKLTSFTINRSTFPQLSKGFYSRLEFVTDEANEYNIKGYNTSGVYKGNDNTTRYTAESAGLLKLQYDLNLNTFLPSSDNMNLIVSSGTFDSNKNSWMEDGFLDTIYLYN